jgi:penicillinase repressor
VQAIWMTRAHSISSRGLAPSMSAKLAFTAISEIPLFGSRAAAISPKRGIYALPGSAPAYVPTSDAIISALSKKPMKLGLLVQHVNKSTNRSRGTIRTVLSRLIKQGTVKQEQKYGGEYRLVRRMRRGESVRRHQRQHHHESHKQGDDRASR